jgi:hypothetical protein
MKYNANTIINYRIFTIIYEITELTGLKLSTWILKVLLLKYRAVDGFTGI